MARKTKILTGLGVTLAVLAACDGSDGVAGNPVFQFGPVFAAAFNARPNSVPAENLVITYLGVDGINLTADPVDF